MRVCVLHWATMFNTFKFLELYWSQIITCIKVTLVCRLLCICFVRLRASSLRRGWEYFDIFISLDVMVLYPIKLPLLKKKHHGDTISLRPLRVYAQLWYYKHNKIIRVKWHGIIIYHATMNYIQQNIIIFSSVHHHSSTLGLHGRSSKKQHLQAGICFHRGDPILQTPESRQCL